MSLIPAEFQWKNFAIAWKEGSFGIYFFNSVIYTFFTVIGVLFLSSLAAYAFARIKFPGSQVLFYFFIASMMIPIPGAFIPLYVLLIKLGIVNTRIGLILPYINSGLALAIFILKGFFEEIPKELDEAAAVDGCSRFTTYWYVMLPIARPALATVGIFTALNVWNEFILALIIISNRSLMPIQRGIMVFQGQYVTDYPLLMAGLTIATIPILVVYFAMQKNIIKGLTAGAVKG